MSIFREIGKDTEELLGLETLQSVEERAAPQPSAPQPPGGTAEETAIFLNIVVLTANTPALYTFPPNVKSYTIKTRNANSLRVALDKDQIKSSVGIYFTVPSGSGLAETSIGEHGKPAPLFAPIALYLMVTVADTVEIIGTVKRTKVSAI